MTRNLKAPILMMVFFGDCALNTRAEMDAVIGPFKELARETEKAPITLGFENTIKAEDDLRILDAEIRALGKHRICQFHIALDTNSPTSNRQYLAALL